MLVHGPWMDFRVLKTAPIVSRSRLCIFLVKEPTASIMSSKGPPTSPQVKNQHSREKQGQSHPWPLDPQLF